MIGLVTRIAPNAMLPDLVESVCKSLRDHRLFEVTLEEFMIMKWPEGQLYDTTVLDK